MHKGISSWNECALRLTRRWRFGSLHKKKKKRAREYGPNGAVRPFTGLGRHSSVFEAWCFTPGPCQLRGLPKLNPGYPVGSYDPHPQSPVGHAKDSRMEMPPPSVPTADWVFIQRRSPLPNFLSLSDSKQHRSIPASNATPHWSPYCILIPPPHDTRSRSRNSEFSQRSRAEFLR